MVMKGSRTIDGCWTGIDLRETIMDRVLFALNNTTQSFAQCEIICKSVFRILVASSGRTSMMYKLVSSANSHQYASLCHLCKIN